MVCDPQRTFGERALLRVANIDLDQFAALCHSLRVRLSLILIKFLHGQNQLRFAKVL